MSKCNMGGSMNDKKNRYYPIIIIFTAAFVVAIIACSFLERVIWWSDANSSKAKGIVFRKDSGVVSAQKEEGLAAFKYRDGVLYFRWSTPWRQGFWPFVKTAKIKVHKKLTGMRLRMILGDYETQEWR